jgi:phosphopantothenoylcysteine decarboxylase
MSRFVADQNRTEGSVHVLLIATGSVASIKAPLIVQELLSVSFQACHGAIANPPSLQYDTVKIQVVATKPSLTFFDALKLKQTGTSVWVDEDEWDVRI